MRLEERTVLNATPERAWALLTDWERQASWMPDVAWVRLGGTERRLGARLRVRTKVFGVPLVTDSIRVTGWDPPHRLAIEHEGFVRGLGAWLLDPAGAGRTSFVWHEDLRMAPPLLGDLAVWIYSPWQRWMLRRSMANFRRVVEEGG
jgi:carbon monoxide dehydrogenase subunit G